MAQLRCPYCRSCNTDLVDGIRLRRAGYTRRRLCNDCNRKFNTIEEYALTPEELLQMPSEKDSKQK